MKILLLTFLSLLFFSCKQEEKLIKNKTELSQMNNIKVSFISIGSGIEKSGIQKLESLISNFEQSNNLKLTVSIKNWGREGEKDFCIDCSEISSDKKEELKVSIETLFKESKIIRVIFDTLCA